MNKRIIICGPTCSGKTVLRKRLEDKGFVFDVSYTTRQPRPGELNEIHYHFIDRETFNHGIDNGWFYEWVEYNGNYYGTGNAEWNELMCFIMETDGIKHISFEDRKNCFVIYLNPCEDVRIKRMISERGWSIDAISDRLETDRKKFKDFLDYDLEITNECF